MLLFGSQHLPEQWPNVLSSHLIITSRQLTALINSHRLRTGKCLFQEALVISLSQENIIINKLFSTLQCTANKNKCILNLCTLLGTFSNTFSELKSKSMIYIWSALLLYCSCHRNHLLRTKKVLNLCKSIVSALLAFSRWIIIWSDPSSFWALL